MITDRLFAHITTHTIRTAFLAFAMSMLMAGVAYGGGTEGTFTANAPKIITASVTDTQGIAEGTEQYKLTVEKGTGVNEVTLTPSSSDGFYDKGTTVTVQSATYNTGYEADSGIGQSYIMDSARSASVTAKKITYTVTYNYNLPSGWTNNGGLPAAQTKIYGDNLALSSTKPAVPTKATDTSYTSGGTGYQYKKTYSATFKEWNTKADGTGAAYAAGGTYSSNAAVTLYAIWTTSTGKTGEQYKLTVEKGTGVDSVTVKVGSATISPVTSGGNTYWIDKGATATISATAKFGYKITGGTGSTGAITSAKTINITSAIDKPATSVTLSLVPLSGSALNKITKVRIYYYDNKFYDEYTYTDSSSYTNMPVWINCKVVLYHDASYKWMIAYNYNPATGRLQDYSIGPGAACNFTVPSQASGAATLVIDQNYRSTEQSLDYPNNKTTGWISTYKTDCVPVLGE